MKSSTAANPDWEAVAASASQSVVAITVDLGHGSGQGSGIVLDKEGHVRDQQPRDRQRRQRRLDHRELSDGKSYDATVVGTDPSTDLAVRQDQQPAVEPDARHLRGLDQVSVGDAVMASATRWACPTPSPPASSAP